MLQYINARKPFETKFKYCSQEQTEKRWELGVKLLKESHQIGFIYNRDIGVVANYLNGQDFRFSNIDIFYSSAFSINKIGFTSAKHQY